MKRPLYYAIKRRSITGLRVVAVTTVKGHRWYGRECRHENSTHGTMSDLFPGQFPNQEEALKVVEGMARIGERYEHKRKELMLEVHYLHRAETQEIELFLKEHQNATD